MSDETDFFTMGRTFLFSCYVAAYRCTTIIQIMCYAVKIASPLAIFGTTENENQRLQKKFSLPVRTFSREISTGKNNSVQPGQNFQNQLPDNLSGI